MGAATAYALRRAGHEPVVLEQFEVGHTRGSSHGRGRIFRLVYDDPRWVAQAQAVVVTAGSWVGPLLEPLGISPPVTPTRESVVYFPLASRDGLPTVIDWRVPDGYDLPRRGDSVYALPTSEGLKVGVHRTGPPTDPGEEGAVDPEAVRCSRDWVARHVDGAGPEPSRTETCLYTNMPDESFVLERKGRLVVGSPCSGHGFKFAPLVGRELADLALEALA